MPDPEHIPLPECQRWQWDPPGLYKVELTGRSLPSKGPVLLHLSSAFMTLVKTRLFWVFSPLTGWSWTGMNGLVSSTSREGAGQEALHPDPAQRAGDTHQVRKGDGESPA